MKEPLYEIALILENMSKKDTSFAEDLKKLSEIVTGFHLNLSYGIGCLDCPLSETED
jgi:hypothetical protein